MEDTAGWSIDAELAFPPMRDLGWLPEWLPWRSESVDWNRYDAVYIGTPWDYPEDPERFMALLDAIDRSRAVLVNDLALVRWTLPKTYLRDLEARGAAIVPSLWETNFERDRLDGYFVAHATDGIIIKPVVSTNATDTFRLRAPVPDAVVDELVRTFRCRDYFVQPFIVSILDEGEASLFFFGQDYSHAIRKTPRPGDFRVQEEHGSEIVRIEPEASLLDAADTVIGLVDPAPVYARCDFVRGPDGRHLLMELEVVEPSMYLRMDEGSPRRFAKAFDDYVREKQGESDRE